MAMACKTTLTTTTTRSKGMLIIAVFVLVGALAAHAAAMGFNEASS